jgi:hypothetical protein
LPLPRLERTPIASKFIEYSKFLTSLLPFGLGEKTNTAGVDSKKPAEGYKNDISLIIFQKDIKIENYTDLIIWKSKETKKPEI